MDRRHVPQDWIDNKPTGFHAIFTNEQPRTTPKGISEQSLVRDHFVA
jgi:hypothetical protein